MIDQGIGVAEVNNADMLMGLTVDDILGLAGTGVVDGSDAAAGRVGEFLSSVSGATNVVSTVAKTIASVLLTPGDWDVWGSMLLNPSVSMSNNICGISTTNNTFPSPPYYAQLNLAGQTINSMAAPMQRFNVTVNTTIYLVGFAVFASGTCTATGALFARRQR